MQDDIEDRLKFIIDKVGYACKALNEGRIGFDLRLHLVHIEECAIGGLKPQNKEPNDGKT